MGNGTESEDSRCRKPGSVPRRVRDVQGSYTVSTRCARTFDTVVKSRYGSLGDEGIVAFSSNSGRRSPASELGDPFQCPRFLLYIAYFTRATVQVSHVVKSPATNE